MRPPPGTKQIEIDDAMLEALLDGIVLEEKKTPESKRRRPVHQCMHHAHVVLTACGDFARRVNAARDDVTA
jgi:hypothetical protein